MTNLQNSIRLVDQDNPANLPDVILDQFQSLATLINSAVQDPHLSRQGIAQLTLLHQHLTTVMQEFSSIIQDTQEERDTAYDNLAVLEEEHIKVSHLYDDLKRAVKNVDADHDLVSDLIEHVEEWTGEQAMDYAYETIDENLACFFQSMTGLTERECEHAAAELTSQDPELSNETIRLIRVLVEKLQEIE